MIPRTGGEISEKELRLFLVLWTPLFLFYAMASFAAGSWRALLVAMIFSILTGIAKPRLAKPLYVFLGRVTLPFRFVFTHLILMLAFFAVITPIGFFLRLTGRDPLAKKKEAGSYWAEVRDAGGGKDYFRRF